PVRASVGRALSRVASAAYERSRPRAAGGSGPSTDSDWRARFSIYAIPHRLPHNLTATVAGPPGPPSPLGQDPAGTEHPPAGGGGGGGGGREMQLWEGFIWG